MAKYKITFVDPGLNRKITKNVRTKAEMAGIARAFRSNGIEYETQVYDKNKETNRCGWSTYPAVNYCCKCGRLLTDPDSVRLGIGPVCRKKYGIPDNTESIEDPRTKILNGEVAQKVLNSIPAYKRENCSFCSGKLIQTVFYYEHEGGWFVESLNKKVWIWLECSKCGHQWSLEHLRVSRSINF